MSKHLSTRAWSRAGRIGVAVAGVVALVATAAPAGAAVTAPSAPRVPTATSGPALGQVALGWVAPSSTGGSAILEYGFDRSTDGGLTWSTTTWFASTALTASSGAQPALACANSGGGANGQGCQYRVRARNAVGVSAPSPAVKTWIAPTAPRTTSAIATDATLSAATVAWTAPATTGSFPTLTYTVLRSDDGVGFAPVATTTDLTATVPCVGALSCAFRVTATNGQGTSPQATVNTITTAPGRAQSLTALVTSTDLGTGVSQLDVSWRPPTTGLPATSYLVQSCQVPAGAVTGCADTTGKWSGSTAVAAAPDVVRLSSTCTAGTASCYFRVAAVNERGGIGAWRSVNLQPWAPFNLTAVPGPGAGQITIAVGGPSETGPNGAMVKRYEAFVCNADCGTNASWRDTELSLPYPLTNGSVGVYACGTATTCQLRMRFVSGNGAVGPLSAVASATGLSLSVTTPADGALINDTTPTVGGRCTIGAGAVTATIQPGAVTASGLCSATGTWSATVADATPLASGAYSVSATQAGTVPGAISNTSTFTLDADAPVLTITSPTPGSTLTTPALVLTGTCSESGRPVTVTIASPPVPHTTDCVNGTWSTAEEMPNGTFTVVASQTDAAGNTGTSATVSFTVSSTGYAVNVASPADGAVLKTSQPSVNGLCTTAAGTVTVVINGPSPSTRTTACTNAAWSLAPAPTLADGLYTIVASQTVSGVTFTHPAHTFRIDTVAPVTTDNSTSYGPAWRSTAATITLTPSDPNPGSGVAATYYTTDGSTPTTASTKGTTISLTADGIYTIRYFSVDVAGNVEPARTAAAQIRIDRIAPTIQVTFPTSGGRYNATKWAAGCATPGACGVAGDPNAPVTAVDVSVQRLSDSRWWDGTAWVVGATTVRASGTTSWALPLAATNLTNGVSYTVTAYATDVAGNRSSGDVHTFTYDTSGPTVKSIAATNASWSLSSGDTFAVTFSEAIDPLSVPTTGTLTLRNNGGDCNNVVTTYQISGLTSSAQTLSTGSCGYLKGTGGTLTTVTWDGTFAVSGATVTFTVTSGCLEATCASSLTSAAPSSTRQNALAFIPAPTIADAAGNAIGTTTTTTSFCRNGTSAPCGAVW